MPLPQEVPQGSPRLIDEARRRALERKKRRKGGIDSLLAEARRRVEGRRETLAPAPEARVTPAPEFEPPDVTPGPIYPGGAPARAGLLPARERPITPEPVPEPRRGLLRPPEAISPPSPAFPGGAPAAKPAEIAFEAPEPRPERSVEPISRPAPTRRTPEMELESVRARPPAEPEPAPVKPLLKPGVNWSDMSANVQRMWPRVEEIALATTGTRPIVTSARMEAGEVIGTETQIHKTGSRHYQGDAFDLRIRGLKEDQIKKYRDSLAEELGDTWDVLIEDDHIHVEHQVPIRMAQAPTEPREPSQQERVEGIKERLPARMRAREYHRAKRTRAAQIPEEAQARSQAYAQMAIGGFLPGKLGEDYEERVMENAPPGVDPSTLAYSATLGRMLRFPAEVMAFGPIAGRVTSMAAGVQAAFLQRLAARFPSLISYATTPTVLGQVAKPPFTSALKYGARQVFPHMAGGLAFGVGLEGIEAAGDIAAGEEIAGTLKHRAAELARVAPWYAALGGGLGFLFGTAAADLSARAYAGAKRAGTTAKTAADELARSYTILGTHPRATDAEIKLAYRRASMKAHPDHPNGSHSRMTSVGEAYEKVRKARGMARPAQEKREPTGWTRPTEQAQETATARRAREIELETERIVNEEADLAEAAPTPEAEIPREPLQLPPGRFKKPPMTIMPGQKTGAAPLPKRAGKVDMSGKTDKALFKALRKYLRSSNRIQGNMLTGGLLNAGQKVADNQAAISNVLKEIQKRGLDIDLETINPWEGVTKSDFLYRFDDQPNYDLWQELKANPVPPEQLQRMIVETQWDLELRVDPKNDAILWERLDFLDGWGRLQGVDTSPETIAAVRQQMIQEEAGEVGMFEPVEAEVPASDEVAALQEEARQMTTVDLLKEMDRSKGSWFYAVQDELIRRKGIGEDVDAIAEEKAKLTPPPDTEAPIEVEPSPGMREAAGELEKEMGTEPPKRDVEVTTERPTATDLWGEEQPIGPPGPEQPELFREKEARALSEAEEHARAIVSTLEGKVQRGEASPDEVLMYGQALQLLRRGEAISEEELRATTAIEKKPPDEQVGELDLQEKPLRDERTGEPNLGTKPPSPEPFIDGPKTPESFLDRPTEPNIETRHHNEAVEWDRLEDEATEFFPDNQPLADFQPGPAERIPRGEKPLKSLKSNEDLDPPFEQEPAELPDGTVLYPISPVELTRMVHKLLGRGIMTTKDPRVYGVFYPRGPESLIKLNKILGKDHDQLRRTIAHEIGHLGDYLDEMTMARGNILGRVGSLKGYMIQTLDALPTSPSKAITPDERAEIRKAAEKWAGPRPDSKKKKEEYALWKERRDVFYRERLEELVQERNLLTLEVVKEETKGISDWWRPWDESTASENTRRYRNSSKEIFADVLSVFLNSPGSLQGRAPNFFNAWLAYMERKPSVKEAYDEIQNLLSTPEGREQMVRDRLDVWREGALRGEEITKEAAEARKQRAQSRFEEFLQTWVSRAAPGEKAEKVILGRLPAWHPDRKWTIAQQEWRHKDSIIRAILQDLFRDVTDPIEQAGITRVDVGTYVANIRIAYGDRGGLPKEAQQLIREITLPPETAMKDWTWAKARRAYVKLAEKDIPYEPATDPEGVDIADYDAFNAERFDPELLETAESGVLNPFNTTDVEAKENLIQLEKDLGPEKWKALESAIANFRGWVYAPIEHGVKIGTINRALHDKKILPNTPYYAAFALNDLYNGTMMGGVQRQTGTLGDIHNAFTATIQKTLQMYRMNAKQEVVLGLLEFAEGYPEGSISPEFKISRPHHPEKRPPPGKANLRYLKDGKPVYRQVDQHIYDQIKGSDMGRLEWIERTIGSPFYKIWHPVFVTLSPGWNIKNAPRDFKRTYVELAIAHADKTIPVQLAEAIVDLAYRLPLSYLKTFSAAKAHAKGRYHPMIREMLGERALGKAFHSYGSQSEHDTLERLLLEAGVQPPEYEGLKGRAKRVANLAQSLGIGSETWGKAAAYKIYTDLGFSGQQRALLVRTHSGTPDSENRGLASPAANSLWFYLNVQVAGMRARWQVLREPTTLLGAVFRSTLVDYGPKIFMMLGAMGVFGAGLSIWFDHIPSYDKEKYLILPISPLGPFYVKTASGKKKAIYLRIPHEDVNRIPAAAMWALVMGTRYLPNPIGRAVNILAGEFPGLNPGLDLGLKWGAAYAGDRNPYDAWLGREWLPKNAFEVGGWPKTREVLRATSREFGIASELAGPWTYGQPNEEQTGLEKILRSPVGAMTGLSAIVRISDRGLREQNDLQADRHELLRRELREDLSEGVHKATGDRYVLNRWNTAGVELTPEQKSARVQHNRWYNQYYQVYTEAMEFYRDNGDEANYKKAKDALNESVKIIGVIPSAARPAGQFQPRQPPQPPTGIRR